MLLPSKKTSPSLHHLTPTIQHVGAPVSSLDVVPDSVRQRNLGHVPGEIGPFSGPIPKARAQPKCPVPASVGSWCYLVSTTRQP